MAVEFLNIAEAWSCSRAKMFLQCAFILELLVKINNNMQFCYFAKGLTHFMHTFNFFCFTFRCAKYTYLKPRPHIKKHLESLSDCGGQMIGQMYMLLLVAMVIGMVFPGNSGIVFEAGWLNSNIDTTIKQSRHFTSIHLIP